MKYAAGCAGVVAGLLALGLAAAPVRDHPAVWLGLLGAAAIQVPLGWAVIRRVGQPGFLTAWGFGLVVRIALVAALALVAGPALGLRPEPLLLTAVGTLFMLLLVEGFVTFVELPGTVQR